MKLNDGGNASELDRTLVALADPTRRAILQRLTRGEARITELAQPFEMSLNAVSKHIRLLENAGLVCRRKVWREHFVSFNPLPLENVSRWIDEQRQFWNPRLDVLDELLRETSGDVPHIPVTTPEKKVPPHA